jgi:hypothetical protein
MIYSGDFQNPTDCRSLTIRNTHAVPHNKLRKYMRDFRLAPRSRWELRSSGSLRSEYRSHLQGPKDLPETSIRNFQYSLRNNLEEWRSPKYDERNTEGLLQQFTMPNKRDLMRYQAVCLLTHSCNRVLEWDIQQVKALKFIFVYFLHSEPFFCKRKQTVIIV